jgi:hypothetical protein
MKHNHKRVFDILADIDAQQDETAIVDSLHSAPKPIRALLAWTFGDHKILPDGEVQFESISPAAFTRADHMSQPDFDADLLSAECMRLGRLFTEGGHPTLTDARRKELFSQVLSRLPHEEALMLNGCRLQRRLVGFRNITKEAVTKAGILEPMRAPDPAEARPPIRRIFRSDTMVNPDAQENARPNRPSRRRTRKEVSKRGVQTGGS